MNTLIEMLDDMAILMTLVVGGTVAIGVFLRLATFSWRDISFVGGTWLFAGLGCAFLYPVLAVLLTRSSPMIAFPLALITGLLLFMLPSSPSNKRVRKWMPYAAWVYFWITAIMGWRAGWLGLLTITLPVLVIAGLGLFFVAGFLLPLPEHELYRGEDPAPPAEGFQIPTFGEEIQGFFALLRYPQNREALKRYIKQRRTALRCLLTYTLGTNYPYYIVIDEKIAERTGDSRTWLTEEDKLIQRLDGDLFENLLAGPGIILTGCDHAVVISSGTRFKGAKGPGVIFTSAADRAKQVIDLRVQLRAFPVEAWTKDGIAVKVVTFIPFQIGAGGKKPALGQGFPYRSSDVFKAVHAQTMEHVDLSQVPENLQQKRWYDLPEIAGERIMREIISRYEFDELYAPFELYDDPSQHPRAKIAAELRQKLDQVLPDWGIQRIGGGISNLMPVDERVIEQRIEAWRADWARKIMLKQADGQSRRLRLVEQARVQAQIDIITAIGKRIERLRATEAPVPLNTVAHYFVEVIEELAERRELRQLLPGDIDKVIQAARGVAQIEAGGEGG